MADENTDMLVADEQEDQARYGITVGISAILGVAEMTVENVLRLGRDALIELERGANETIESIADGQLVARGEVVVVDEMLTVQVTEIVKQTNWWNDASKQRMQEMKKPIISRAEEQFTATQKKDERALKAKDKAEQERADKRARLKALRLAKEASDAEGMD